MPQPPRPLASTSSAGASAAAPKPKADFSTLWGDGASADVTIKIKTAEAAHQQQEQKQQQQAEPRPSKRPRRTRSSSSAAAAAAAVQPHEQEQQEQQEEPGVVATLRVHERVLTDRSGYLEAMLLGAGAGMVEGRSKSVTVELEDAQEAADFQRLIRLSYMPLYTKDPDDGHRLSKEELLRLLLLGDRFGMVSCVEECAHALCPFDGYDEALALFHQVPEGLLDTAPMSFAVQGAGDALAAALGPVEKLWTPAETYNVDEWLDSHVLDERVKALPLLAMEAVLRSEELQLKSENDTFTLVRWRLNEQEGDVDEVCQPMFNRLLKSLRYARMSAPFLACIVDDLWVKDSGLAVSILRRALWRRDDAHRENDTIFPASPVKGRDRYNTIWSLTTHFTRAEFEGMREEGGRITKPLGMVQGFPCYLEVIRQENGTFAVCTYSNFLNGVEIDKALDTPGEAEWEGQDDDGGRGFEFTIPRGTIGGNDVVPDTAYEVTLGGSDPILEGCFLEEFFFDKAGKLIVELKIQMEQHSEC